MKAVSTSPFAAQLLAGRRRKGVALGPGYVLFGDAVLALTQPGALRMPNGIETDLRLKWGERVEIGNGVLTTATTSLTAGPLWDPRPRVRVRLTLPWRPRLRLRSLAGRGPGLTPLGDDVLVGFLAGCILSGADPDETAREAEAAARKTTALSRTLLRLAARGELPEAAHRLLEEGDPEPLRVFGHTSGKGIALGLALSPLGDEPC